MHASVKLIAIAGPTGSGKTRLAQFLQEKLGKNKCVVISQDDYYKDWSHLSKKKRKKINFDHKDSFDFKLLSNHLALLKRGRSIKTPCYSFIESKRLKTTSHVIPQPYLIVEGLMPFVNVKFANLYDLKIYIDANNATCFIRRLKRDIKERGDKFEIVCTRYLKHVLPMQKQFVEPQKRMADLIVNGETTFNNALITRILKRISE